MLIPQYPVLVLKLSPIYTVSLNTVFSIPQNQCYPGTSCTCWHAMQGPTVCAYPITVGPWQQKQTKTGDLKTNYGSISHLLFLKQRACVSIVYMTHKYVR